MTRRTPSRGARARKLAFRIHRWLGVYLGVPLFVVCSSGALAVLGHEWDWLGDSARRAESAEVDWDAVDAALADEAPELLLSNVVAPVEPGHAAVAVGAAPNGQLQYVLLEPATGEVRGRRSVLSIQVYLRQFHKTLVAPYAIYFVTLLGFGLLFSALTGILVYRRFWQHLLRLRFGQGIRVLAADVHRTLGVWSLALAVVVAVTGVWYFAERLAHDVADASVEPELRELSEARLAALGPVPERLPVGALVEAARRAMPDLDVRLVRLPTEVGHAAEVHGQTGAWLVRDRASRVWLDPYSGEVLGAQRAERLGPLHRWSDTADPLHFGDFAGLPIKLLWLVLGGLLSVAVLAGPALAELRRARRRRADAPPPSRWRPAVLVAGGLSIVALAVAVGASAFGYQQRLVSGDPPAQAVAGPVEVGPWRLYVTAHGPLDAEGTAFVVRTESGRPASWQRAALQGAGEPEALREGRAWLADPSRVIVTSRDGQEHRAPLRFVDASAPEAVRALRALGLDEAPLPAPTYVLGFIVALLVFELAGVLVWLWLAWRASGGSRRPGAAPAAPSPKLTESLS